MYRVIEKRCQEKNDDEAGDCCMHQSHWRSILEIFDTNFCMKDIFVVQKMIDAGVSEEFLGNRGAHFWS
jgi:hypothetical protein